MAVTVLRKRIGKAIGWQTNVDAGGWLEVWRIVEADCFDIFTANAGRNGLGRFVAKHGRVEEHLEFFIGRAPDAMFDTDEAAAREQLLQELSAIASTPPQTWTAPAAKQMSRWLVEAGFEPAIDKDENLRLTLKRPGCDGAVRVERGSGRCRIFLPLGAWPTLAPVCEQAMCLLANFVNGQCRLGRIALHREGDARRFESQADLRGLPLLGDAIHDRLWREMMAMSVKAMELALRQLGLELPLLAENPELAQAVLDQAESRRNRSGEADS